MRETVKFAVGCDSTVDALVRHSCRETATDCAKAIEGYRDLNFAPGQPHAPATAYDALTQAARICRDMAALSTIADRVLTVESTDDARDLD